MWKYYLFDKYYRPAACHSTILGVESTAVKMVSPLRHFQSGRGGLTRELAINGSREKA